MKVRMIAFTAFDWDPVDDLIEWDENLVSDADTLAEFAGRACYQSWDRPNPATATTKGYLENIIRQQHFSVLEHSSATFYIEGVSRSLTHELVRHRHLSFSQLSQRYVDESNAEFVTPPAFKANIILDGGLKDYTYSAVESYSEVVEILQSKGLSRKKAREAARAVLPNCTETKIVVTGNHRAWRDFLTKRLSPAADAEIRELAQELLRQLRLLAPATYQDFEE